VGTVFERAMVPGNKDSKATQCYVVLTFPVFSLMHYITKLSKEFVSDFNAKYCQKMLEVP